MLQKFMENLGIQRKNVSIGRAESSIISTLPHGNTQPFEDDKSFMQSYIDAVWVYVSVSAIAESAAQVPFKIFNMKNRDKPIEVTYEDMFKFFRFPNTKMSQYRLWEGSFSFLRLTGDCYWEIQGTIEKPEKIYLLRPDRIQASLDAKLGVREYLYWPRGNKGGDKPVIFAPNEIVHFKTFNPLNEFEGLSPLNPTKLSIAADLLSQKYNVKFFENDATPHGVYMTDQVLNTDKLNLIEEKIIKFLQNTRNKFSPIILHGGLKYQPVSMGPKDAEFATGRDLNRQDILSGQRVPPAVAGISNQNFAESNLQSKIFRQYRLLPMLRAMQADLDNLVLQHLGPNLHCMFDVQDVEEFRDEMVEQELRLRTQFDRGIIGINEYRKALRLPLVNEKLGSKRFILSSLSELTEDGVILAQPHTSTPQESKEEAYTHLNKELLELLQR